MSAAVASQRPIIHLRTPVVDVTFKALGTDVRLMAEGFGARDAIVAARLHILVYHERLSRFIPTSELSMLNHDPSDVVSTSDLLRSAVGAGLWAAEMSDGLVDPCLFDALCLCGYEKSFEPGDAVPAPSGPAQPATAHPDRLWQSIRIDDEAGTIERPAGLRLDLGGSGKGHVADQVAPLFTALPRWVVDCGGDIRVGGTREIQIAHPSSNQPAATLELNGAAVATSSIMRRAWLTSEGQRAHHLIDPGTGRPAWTGLLSATAIAPTTLHAETLAKTALLLGAEGAREVLAPEGGLIVHANGDVELIGQPTVVAP